MTREDLVKLARERARERERDRKRLDRSEKALRAAAQTDFRARLRTIEQLAFGGYLKR